MTYLRQEYENFPVQVGGYDVPSSLELSPYLVLKSVTLSLSYSSHSKGLWLWKKDSEALSVFVCFQLLLLKELWRPTQRHDRVVNLLGK